MANEISEERKKQFDEFCKWVEGKEFKKDEIEKRLKNLGLKTPQEYHQLNTYINDRYPDKKHFNYRYIWQYFNRLSNEAAQHPKDENGDNPDPNKELENKLNKWVEDLAAKELTDEQMVTEIEGLGLSEKADLEVLRDKLKKVDSVDDTKGNCAKALQTIEQKIADFGAKPEEQKEEVKIEQGDDENKNSNSNDYDEDVKVGPEKVQKLKAALNEYGIKYKATAENQTDYPFNYNLYKEGETTPNGKLEVKTENHVVLTSKELSHFVAMMKGLRDGGTKEINLKLNENTSLTAQKEFAARALIAGTLAGIEVNTPESFRLDDLMASKECSQELKDMLGKVKAIQDKKNEAQTAANEFSKNNTQENQDKLEGAVNAAWEEYKKFPIENLPGHDQLKTFECGVNGARHEATKNIVNNIIKAQQKTK